MCAGPSGRPHRDGFRSHSRWRIRLGHVSQDGQAVLVVEFGLGARRLCHDRRIIRSRTPGKPHFWMRARPVAAQRQKRNNPRIPVGTGTGGVPHSEESRSLFGFIHWTTEAGKRFPNREAPREARLREAVASGDLREPATEPSAQRLGEAARRRRRRPAWEWAMANKNGERRS